MALNDLSTKLETEGLFVIQTEGSTDKDDSRGLVFVGDLDKFINAAKALKSDIIFITTRLLDHEDFLYEVEEDYEDDDNGKSPEPIQLSTILPTLKEYEKYIGKECAFKLTIRTTHSVLEFYTQEIWWAEFREMLWEAIDKLENVRKDKRLTQLSEKIARQKGLLDQLRKLINDSAFVKLPTQKAMLVYAIEQIPELEDMNQNLLKAEIQNLDAKLAAKGLGRKR